MHATINKLKAYSSILLAITIWGTLPSILKLILKDLSIISVVSIRFIFSSILLIYFMPRIIRKFSEISLNIWLKFFLIVGIMFFTQTYAVALVPVNWYVVIFSICPVILAICFRYKFKPIAIVSLFIVFISLYCFLSQDRKEAQYFHFFPFLMLFIGMISWVFYSVIINKLHKAYNDIEITALTCYAGAIVNIPFFVLNLEHSLLNKISEVLIACIMGALLLIAFFCYSYGMRKEPIFCIFSQYLEPIFGLIAASIFIGSTVTIPQMVSVFFIIAGTIIISINTKPSITTQNIIHE